MGEAGGNRLIIHRAYVCITDNPKYEIRRKLPKMNLTLILAKNRILYKNPTPCDNLLVLIQKICVIHVNRYKHQS